MLVSGWDDAICVQVFPWRIGLYVENAQGVFPQLVRATEGNIFLAFHNKDNKVSGEKGFGLGSFLITLEHTQSPAVHQN